LKKELFKEIEQNESKELKIIEGQNSDDLNIHKPNTIIIHKKIETTYSKQNSIQDENIYNRNELFELILKSIPEKSKKTVFSNEQFKKELFTWGDHIVLTNTITLKLIYEYLIKNDTSELEISSNKLLGLNQRKSILRLCDNLDDSFSLTKAHKILIHKYGHEFNICISTKRDLELMIAAIKSVTTHGILTQVMANKLNIIQALGNDPINNPTKEVYMNFIFDAEGIQASLLTGANGGISVALERRGDPLIQKDINDSSVLKELSERAHQTILIGMQMVQGAKKEHESCGCAKLSLTYIDGETKETEEGVYLGYKHKRGLNEIRAYESIAPSNFSFILVHEKMLPYLDYVKHTGNFGIITVDSTNMKVNYNRMNITIPCPNYAKNLRAILHNYPDGLLTHVLRVNTEADEQIKSERLDKRLDRTNEMK
jgi:hypothetical protein